MNISLKNKNLNKKENIKCILCDSYIDVYHNNISNLKKLQCKVKESLVNDKGILKNYFTEYEAKITNETINKILHPAPNFNIYDKKYINNINAACYLKKLFESAVYIDTLKPMKNKSRNINELGYHHFVSPLIMNNKLFRVLLTAR